MSARSDKQDFKLKNDLWIDWVYDSNNQNLTKCPVNSMIFDFINWLKQCELKKKNKNLS